MLETIFQASASSSLYLATVNQKMSPYPYAGMPVKNLLVTAFHAVINLYYYRMNGENGYALDSTSTYFQKNLQFKAKNK